MRRKRKSAPLLRRRSRRAAAPAARERSALPAATIEKILGRVARVFTHETRNIVASFTTCLEMLRRNPQLNPDDRELINIMHSGTARLNEIIEQFAAFGRRDPPRFESLSLPGLIHDTLRRLRGDKRCSAAIEFSPRFDPLMEPITADRKGLSEVFWQLFLNAVQAMGDRGRLEVEAKPRGAGVEIHVRDSGAGISRELRRKIFEPLVTTKTRATGLGLVIARRIVEDHGGTLELCGGGEAPSCFVVKLPKAKT